MDDRVRVSLGLDKPPAVFRVRRHCRDVSTKCCTSNNGATTTEMQTAVKTMAKTTTTTTYNVSLFGGPSALYHAVGVQ